MAILNKDNMLARHGRYFTMVYAIVNLDAGVVSFCRAGHNYPLLIHADGSSEYLEGGGPPIGLDISREEREGQEVKLSPGERFILFSDGINEAFSSINNVAYGLEQVQDVLTQHFSDPLGKSFDSLITDVKRFQGKEEFSDDVSIIGFEWLGKLDKPKKQAGQ